jgi:hypothetical protein
VKIHRTIHHALLALLLLLSQQMGISHEVTHLASKPGSQTGQPVPLEKSCDQCLAFASIGSALTGNGLLPLVQALAVTVFAIIPGPRYFPAFVSAYHSRAPPLAV